MFNIKIDVGSYDNCYFKYHEREGRLDIWNEDGPVMIVNTIGICGISKDFLAIKNHSENKGIYDELLRLGVIDPVSRYVPVGYVSLMVCKFNKEKIAELNNQTFDDENTKPHSVDVLNTFHY